MGDCNADADQPNRELGVGIASRVAPRPAVVHVHAPGQAEAAKHRDQMRLDGVRLLVLARLQQHRVARVIVEHGQRKAAALTDLKVAFEVHLQQVIGSFVFEATPRMNQRRRVGADSSVTFEDLADRARCRHKRQRSLQHLPDLPRVPYRTRITHLEHELLDAVLGPLW